VEFQISKITIVHSIVACLELDSIGTHKVCTQNFIDLMRVTKKKGKPSDLIIVLQVAIITQKKSRVHDTWYSKMK
jgi:hypothetical protein